jgi:hypothetical protein
MLLLRHQKRFTCEILHKATPIYDLYLPVTNWR